MDIQFKLPSPTVRRTFREVASTLEIEGKRVNLHSLGERLFVPRQDQITSASVVAFTQPGYIATAVLERGLDIPGGHVEPSDRGVAHTIERESYEEARIIIAGPLYLIGVISSDYKGKSLENISYMLIAAGRVERMDTFTAELESMGREIVATDEFLKRYRAGPQKMMEEIIQRANALEGELFGN